MAESSVPIQQAFAAAVRQHQSGQLHEAEASYRRIVAAQPGHADALHMLGIALHQLGRGAEAVQALRRAISVNPRAADYHANLGSVLVALRQSKSAEAEFRAALSLRPDLPEVRNFLGMLLSTGGEFDQAIAEFRQALSQKPVFAEAHGNLGDALRATGQLDEALASYRRAMTISPDARWASSLVYTLHLHPDTTAMQLHEARQRWNQSHAEPLGARVPVHPNDRSPGRKLRVGYVGANFRDHSQSSFLVPLLTAHNRQDFEIFAYPSVAEGDEVTRQISTLVDGWRDITALSDEQAAELVLRDRIDILVDLDVHTPGNRLLLFARKPAPVQVSGLAYPGTTGMLTIDYRLTNLNLDPGDVAQRFYSEQSIYLPDIQFCYSAPMRDTPESELPALRNGYVTFGYLGDFPRVNSRTLDLWAGVLGRVANSRLLLAAPSGACRQRVLDLLARLGVAKERVAFVDSKTRMARLDVLRTMDVCLDTFPWNGRTTSLDSLWMGVPVITPAGEMGISRIGADVLTNLGLGEYIAHSPDEFANAASRAATSLPVLAEHRATLRRRLEESVLMDCRCFARNLESAYRQIWKTWCDSQDRQGVLTTDAT